MSCDKNVYIYKRKAMLCENPHILQFARIHLPSPDNMICCYQLISYKNSCHSKIWYFGVHVHIQKNVASLHISMNNPQSGVLMEIKKSLSNPFNYVNACLSVQNPMSCRIYPNFTPNKYKLVSVNKRPTTMNEKSFLISIG